MIYKDIYESWFKGEDLPNPSPQNRLTKDEFLKLKPNQRKDVLDKIRRKYESEVGTGRRDIGLGAAGGAALGVGLAATGWLLKNRELQKRLRACDGDRDCEERIKREMADNKRKALARGIVGAGAGAALGGAGSYKYNLDKYTRSHFIESFDDEYLNEDLAVHLSECIISEAEMKEAKSFDTWFDKRNDRIGKKRGVDPRSHSIKRGAAVGREYGDKYGAQVGAATGALAGAGISNSLMNTYIKKLKDELYYCKTDECKEKYRKKIKIANLVRLAVLPISALGLGYAGYKLGQNKGKDYGEVLGRKIKMLKNKALNRNRYEISF